MNIQEDIKFAQDEGEMVASEILRWAAAVNLEATRAEFVAAAVAAGYPANSSANRFRESRAFTMKCAQEDGDKIILQKDGKIVDAE